MEINQNIRRQKSAIDLSSYPLQKTPAELETNSPQGKAGELSSGVPLGASAVNLSLEGRSASLSFDFYATTDNLTRLEALRNPDTFARAHAAISYENVKNFLD